MIAQVSFPSPFRWQKGGIGNSMYPRCSAPWCTACGTSLHCTLYAHSCPFVSILTETQVHHCCYKDTGQDYYLRPVSAWFCKSFRLLRISHNNPPDHSDWHSRSERVHWCAGCPDWSLYSLWQSNHSARLHDTNNRYRQAIHSFALNLLRKG